MTAYSVDVLDLIVLATRSGASCGSAVSNAQIMCSAEAQSSLRSSYADATAASPPQRGHEAAAVWPVGPDVAHGLLDDWDALDGRCMRRLQRERQVRAGRRSLEFALDVSCQLHCNM